MNCSSCGAQLPVGVAYCPQCGVVTPYNISDSGASPDDLTALSSPSDASSHTPATDYGSAPYRVPEQDVYAPLNPYAVPQQAPPPPPFHRLSARLSALLVGSIVLFLIGSGAIYYATIFQPNQSHAQATATTLAQQRTATAFANTPEGIYESITRGNPVLDDPLSQNDANTWDESRTTMYSCTFGGGSYHASLQLKGNLAECVSYATNFGNFAFQVQMMILKGDSGGILFRFDSAKFSGYSFTIAQNGTYTLSLWEGSTPENLRSGPSSAIKTGFNQTNLIAVVASGSHLYLYVNKQFVTSVSESTFHSGQIGVQATENSLPTEVAFQHAQVWLL